MIKVIIGVHCRNACDLLFAIERVSILICNITKTAAICTITTIILFMLNCINQ